MAITYSWKITTYKAITVGQLRPVVQVYWEKIGTNSEGISAKFSGVSTFSSFDEENFIDYDNLTEDIIQGWIETETQSYSESINAKIVEQLQSTIIT